MPFASIRRSRVLFFPGAWHRLSLLSLLTICATAVTANASNFSPTGYAPPAAAKAPAAGISGVVQDSTGAIIPGAQVQLDQTTGSVIATANTDGSGQFHLGQPSSGTYELVVTLTGFQTATLPIQIGSGPLPALKVTMDVATAVTQVTVNASADVNRTDPSNNQDTISMSAEDLKSIPVFDDDYVSTMSNFLDAGAEGEDGAGLMVDGVEASRVGVAPSAVQSIRINQDPYSARYYNPGRGQMEIITKNAEDAYHGSANFLFRDSALNATNAFATSKPPEQRRIYEGYLTGPIAHLKKTAFLFSVNRQEEDVYSFINANTAPGVTLQQNVSAPTRMTALSMRVGHQFSDEHSAYVRYEYYNASQQNQGVGGLTLASAAYNSKERGDTLIFHDDLAIGANKLNQFSFVAERNYDPITSASQSSKVVVSGAFTSGGSQSDDLQTEYNARLTDIVSWTHGRHQFMFGAEVPNLSRRVLEDRTNRFGTYSFASLSDYANNNPYSFSIQRGQERYPYHYIQTGAFIQDMMQVTSKLSLTPGLRYDYQNTLGTKDAFSPRISFAYLLDKTHGMVLRGGGGSYYIRVGSNIMRDLIRYETPSEESLLITTNLCYPDITTCNQLGSQPPNVVNLTSGIKTPLQVQYGLSLERQIGPVATATIDYRGSRGMDMLRSIDVNAPLPPFDSYDRPNPNYGQIRQIESEGYQKTDAMDITFRGRVGSYFAGFGQYTWSHGDNNTSYSNFLPENQFDPNAEWSRADWDQRQRMGVFGTIRPRKVLNLGVGFFAHTATPYSITTGTDDYKDGLSNARPDGVPRNSLNAGSYQEVDFRWGYDFKLHPGEADKSPTVGFSLSSFNTLNRVNESGFVGVETSEFFKQPTSAADPRRLQIGARYNF